MTNIKTYDDFLLEAKAVGVLYHFTTPRGLRGILEYDEMTSAHGAISFTRNFDLRSWAKTFGAYCRITFDGDEMSNKFRFAPYLFDPEKDPVLQMPHVDVKSRRAQFGEEQEERIVKNTISNIKRYILQVDVLDSAMKSKEMMAISKVEMANSGIPFNHVTKFEPYRTQVYVQAA